MSLPSMTNYHILVVLGYISLPAVASPLRLGQHNVHFRQLPPAVQINWATSTTTVLESKTTVIDATTASIIPSQANSIAYDDSVPVQNPIFFLPPAYTTSELEPSFSVSVSIITEVQTVSDTFTSTSTIYEQPKVMTITEAPSIVTSDFTVTETFIATPGSFWESPKQFQDLSAFRISHFACGQENLHIINDNILNKTIPSLDIGLGSALNNMELGASFNQELSEILDLKLNSSALQLYYPANSVNPGNYPQGGADFYATPLPLEDAKNVTWQNGCCSSLQTVLIAMIRTETAKRAEKPKMRWRNREVGAVNPTRMFGTMEVMRRYVTTRSSHTVNELEAKAAACKMSGSGIDVSEGSPRFDSEGRDEATTTKDNRAAAPKSRLSIRSNPLTKRETVTYATSPRNVPPTTLDTYQRRATEHHSCHPASRARSLKYNRVAPTVPVTRRVSPRTIRPTLN